MALQRRVQMATPLNSVRNQVEAEILSHSGLSLGGVDYDAPLGDPGLFGPDSVCWKVHRDFTSMIVGGFSALLLQMLHPLALAGVWEHSNFRDDMLGRLRRTARFVAGTTFGPKDDAERLIALVRSIHSNVKGTAPDGRSYSAMNPDLLTWVHVAEARSFLVSRLTYYKGDLTADEQDQYYREYARVAEALGATHVPKSVRDIEGYLLEMKPELVFDERTEEVFNLLRTPRVSKPAHRLFARQAMIVAVDLLPPFARDFYPEIPHLQTQLAIGSIRAVAPVYRWAVRNGAYARARRRMGLPAE